MDTVLVIVALMSILTADHQRLADNPLPECDGLPRWTFHFQDHEGRPVLENPVTVRLKTLELLLGVPVETHIATSSRHLASQTLAVNAAVVYAPARSRGVPQHLVRAEEDGLRIVVRARRAAPAPDGVCAALEPYAGKAYACEVVRDPVKRQWTPERIRDAFAAAREAIPGTLLFMTEQIDGNTMSVERYRELAAESVRIGAPLDAIAVEWEDSNRQPDIEHIAAALKRLNDLNLPLYMFGIPPEEAGAWLNRLSVFPRAAGLFLTSSQGAAFDAAFSDRFDSIVGSTDKNGHIVIEADYGDYEIDLAGHRFAARLWRGTSASVPLRRPPTPEPPASFQMPFDAARARLWQKNVRQRLFELVTAQNPRRDHPLDLRVGESIDRGPYSECTVTLAGNEDTPIEATLTKPHGPGPFPALVCLHGHGGDRAAVHDPDSIYRGLAAEFACRGFVTLAPSLWHCEYASNQLWNLMRLVDALETLPYVDPARIGCAGLSMGGEWTMWLTAMDLHIKAAVVSGWMCSTEGVLSIHNCPCWMTPGLLELCDIAEVHILIAPRPLLFESALADGCFPIRYTEEGYRMVLRGYRALGAPDQVRRHTFPGGHAWNGALAYRFLERVLAQKK